MQNLPDLPTGGKLNLGGVLAWEFLLMHFVEVRRWQDIKNHHSVDEVRGGRRGALGMRSCAAARPGLPPVCSTAPALLDSASASRRW